jgi:hypothetical protein
VLHTHAHTHTRARAHTHTHTYTHTDTHIKQNLLPNAGAPVQLRVPRKNANIKYPLELAGIVGAFISPSAHMQQDPVTLFGLTLGCCVNQELHLAESIQELRDL